MEQNIYRKSGIGDFAAVKAESSALTDIYENDNIERAKLKKSDKKFRRATAWFLIFIFLGVPLLGFSFGFGSEIAGNYLLPRLLSDANQREKFAFENLQNNNVGHLRAIDSPLVNRHDYVDLVNAVKSSVVTITSTMPAPSTVLGQMQSRVHAGTGILMYETSSRYYVATNAHVIEGAQYVSISIYGSPQIPAIPIGRDDANDLAVIAVYKHEAVQAGVFSVTLATFGDSSRSQVGEIVLAIGNAMGEGISVTNGIISAIDLEIFVDGITLEVMQTNAAINRGNSGGPLINVFGEVIGINTAKVSEQVAEGMGFAIPSHIAKPILERIMRASPPQARPTIGINGGDWTAASARSFRQQLLRDGVDVADLIIPEAGFIIATVFADSPAYHVGMLRYDIVTHIDGVLIQNFADLVAHMETRSMGEVAVFTVIRGGIEEIDFRLILGEYIIPTAGF